MKKKKPDSDYQRGIRHAASIVEAFDGQVDHDYRLSDCVLAKFGLLAKSRVRKNRRRKK